MGLKTSVEGWAVSFTALLGLGVLSCGGNVTRNDATANSDGGRAGSGTGATDSGGTTAGSSGGTANASNTGGSTGGASSSVGGVGGSSGGASSSSGAGSSSNGGSGGVDSSSSTGGEGGARDSSTTGGSNDTCTESGTIAGTVYCEEGFAHRESDEECPSILPRDGIVETWDGLYMECEKDSDCTAKNYGRCDVYDLGLTAETRCSYGCVSDADCEDGSICACGSVVGQCLPTADCSTDDDCAGNYYCASFQGYGACWWETGGYACQSDQDMCDSASDCQGEYGLGCSRMGLQRACEQFPWECGRPFIVQGNERRASVEVGNEGWAPTWPHQQEGEAVDLVVAQHWIDVALMEHASVAAFARFTLQLLALGAPAELIEASQRASLDEMEHAQAAFALASRYSGTSLRPGPLSMKGLRGETDPRDVLELVIREGCFGETIAALAASEAALRAREPEVRRLLERVALDERNHAALAWRTVSWALTWGGNELRRFVAEVFERVVSEQSAVEPHPDEQRLAEHGIVVGSLWGEVRARGIEAVIRPLARQLVAQASEEMPQSANISC